VAWAAVALAAAASRPAVSRADEDPATTVEINAVGDIAYPNGWGGIDEVDAKQDGLFDLVKPILAEGDLNFANLECPLTQVVPRVKKTYPIACEPKRLEYVVRAGFNLFSLANNHALDAGEEGAADTRALFRRRAAARGPDERPLYWAGTADTAEAAQRPLLFDVPGKRVRVAFFAVAQGEPSAPVGSLNAPDLDARIAEARQRADLVIVSVHNGTEYVHVAGADVVKRYHALVDAGADLVLGHHPHVVQGVERYRKGVIFYSLGNFSFGSHTVRHHETGARMYSMIGRVRFAGGRVAAVSVVPVYANNTEPWTLGDEVLAPIHCVPQPLSGRFARAALDEIQDFTAAIPGAAPTRLVATGDVARVDPSDVRIAVRHPAAVTVRRAATASKTPKPGRARKRLPPAPPG
jgi:poly-gamma-glutamate capsule biosynthesis protein CapA/YwtB (metallophosphatase superfamily)